MRAGQPYYPQQRQQQPQALAPMQPRPPVVRGQGPETTSLSMPAPETFGIRLGETNNQPLDWNGLRQKLDRLGAISFQLEKQGTGYRFSCRLPNGQVDGVGVSESEAVQAALAKLAR